MTSNPDTSRWRRRARAVAGIDPRALAFFRVGSATILLCDLADRAPDLAAHYTDAGIFPREVARAFAETSVLSIHMQFGGFWPQAALLALAVVAALAMLLGVRTRLATAASWFLLMSLQSRNELIRYGYDDYMRVLLFWAMFLPLGARYAWDRRRAQGAQAPTEPLLTGGGIAILAQIVLMYWFACAMKTGEEWRQSGTALEYALQLDNFVNPLGRWLYQWTNLLRLASRSVWVLEGFGPLLLLCPWVPARVAGVLAFTAFHGGIALFMKLGFFPYLSVVAVALFLPPAVWDLAERKLLRRPLLPAQPQPRTPLAWQLVPLAALAYCVVWLLGTVDPVLYDMPKAARAVGYALRLDQSWGMFAPYPMKMSGWIVAEGRLADGRAVNPWPEGDAYLDGKHPEVTFGLHPNARWTTYTFGIRRADTKEQRIVFARFLCRRARAEGTALAGVDLALMLDVNALSLADRKTEKLTLFRHDCEEPPL